jgi:hypothetical protein
MIRTAMDEPYHPIRRMQDSYTCAIVDGWYPKKERSSFLEPTDSAGEGV